jgi:hypothetical protein
MNLLEYPVTRAIRLRRTWATVLILGAILWITVITLINVAAVGYELVPLTSTSYSSSESLLWYERFMPKSSWFPRSRKCEWATIRLMDG